MKRIAVVTGSRADFGLLRPVMHAIDACDKLELLTIASGAHMLEPMCTIEEVASEFDIAARVHMQESIAPDRISESLAVGRGIGRFAEVFGHYTPDVVLVLGDRIEAFAAAAAASIGGQIVAHIHGGDRAEGIADESMRHAITALSHLHFPASETSERRIRRMGEPAWRVIRSGSPAVDGLKDVGPMSESMLADLGNPEILVLLHPSSEDKARNGAWAEAIRDAAAGLRGIWMAPNNDPCRDAIDRVRLNADGLHLINHLARPRFLSLLRSLTKTGGCMVGNSSAGLLEAAALGLGVVNVGPRQNGRERSPSVIDVAEPDPAQVRESIDRARQNTPYPPSAAFGDGHAGEIIARALASTDTAAPGFQRKCAEE